MLFIILIAAILFGIVAWQRFTLALALLFFLLPTYLIRFHLGPLPSTLLEVMILILFSVWLIQQRHTAFPTLQRLYRQHRSLFIAVDLFLLAATISIFTAVSLRPALGEWRAFYIEPFLVFLMLVTTVKTKKGLHTILYALIFSGFVTSLLAIYQHFTGWMVPYSFWANRSTYRVTAWYGFPNGVGLFLAPLIPIAIYLTKEQWKKTTRRTYLLTATLLLFIPAALFAIWYAKTTGAIVGLVTGIGLLLIIWKKTRYYTLAFGIIGIIGIIFMPDNALKKELLFRDPSGSRRLDMWAETTEYLRQHPLAGTGIASYEEKIAPYRIDRRIEVFHHPHNLLLTMWVNLGLLGLIGFLLILVWFYRVGFQSLKYPSPLPIFILGAMTAYLTTGLVDSPYIKNDLSLLFWLFPAVLLIATTLEEQTAN